MLNFLRKTQIAVRLTLVISVLTPVYAFSEQIKFPEEELATESVLPIFDKPEAVKNRSVPLAKRFELGVGGTYDLAEPFFSPYGINVSASYNFTEEHGINIFYNSYLSGTTNYVNQLNSIPNTTSKFNIQYAPAPKYIFLADYQYTGFYGKLSFTKDYIMNLSLYGLLGAGGYAIGDKLNPTLDVGLGQKFYFNANTGLRFDLRFNFYNGPSIIASGNLPSSTSTQSSASFSQRLFVGSLLSVGFVYLF